jgi:hypothetical protein
MPTANPAHYYWQRSRNNHLFLRSRERANNIGAVITEADGNGFTWRAWRVEGVRRDGHATSEAEGIQAVYRELGLIFK